LFGEKIVVLGANFRQTANVVLCGFVMDVIESNIQSSVLFSQVEILHLTENMRAHNQSAFTKWLTDIGNGSINDAEDIVTILPKYLEKNDLVTAIYKDKIISKED